MRSQASPEQGTGPHPWLLPETSPELSCSSVQCGSGGWQAAKPWLEVLGWSLPPTFRTLVFHFQSSRRLELDGFSSPATNRSDSLKFESAKVFELLVGYGSELMQEARTLCFVN